MGITDLQHHREGLLKAGIEVSSDGLRKAGLAE